MHVGEMVSEFEFTDVEFAILSALLLFPAGKITLLFRVRVKRIFCCAAVFQVNYN